MTPLPAALGGVELVAWRIDQQKYASTWDSGEGAYQAGGRWNSRGRRVVYCAIDPATAILEVAVHKGFKVLDSVKHTLTSLLIGDAGLVHIVQRSDVPNPNWLFPGMPTPSQQQFGDALLAAHTFLVLPSAVSRDSWNLIFDAHVALGKYSLLEQQAFALDPRLHPPLPS